MFNILHVEKAEVVFDIQYMCDFEKSEPIQNSFKFAYHPKTGNKWLPVSHAFSVFD